MSSKNFILHQQMKLDAKVAVLLSISRGATSRREVQAATGLSWGKVSAIVGSLLASGIVAEFAQSPPELVRLGRRTTRFGFSGGAALIAGMEIGGKSISAVLIDPACRRIGATERQFASGHGMEVLPERIREVYRALLESVSAAPAAVGAIAFSLTGAVDVRGKRWLRSSHVPAVDNFDFNALSEVFPETGLLAVEHDIFAKARAVTNSSGIAEENFVFLHIGDGLGLAAHTEAGFFTGSRGFAGELGHIPAVSGGMAELSCVCGGEFCLESRLSSRGLLAFAAARLGVAAGTLSELFGAMTAAESEALYDYMLPFLLQAGITAVNLFDPKLLLLGGEVLEPWLPRLRLEFPSRLRAAGWLGAPERVEFYAMRLCDSAAGAAANLVAPVLSRLAADCE